MSVLVNRGMGPAAWAATRQAAGGGWGRAYIQESFTFAEDN